MPKEENQKKSLRPQNSRSDVKENFNSSKHCLGNNYSGSGRDIKGRQQFRSDGRINVSKNDVLTNSNQLNINSAQSNNIFLRTSKQADIILDHGSELARDTAGAGRDLTHGESSSDRPKVVLRSRTFNKIGNRKLVQDSDGKREQKGRVAGDSEEVGETARMRVRFDIEGVSDGEEDRDGQVREETCQSDNNRGPHDMENQKLAAKKVKQTVSHTDWRSLLAEFGRLPTGQRGAAWCALLRLPRGAAIHAALCKKPIHAGVLPYDNMADQTLRTAFRSILSCLFHWAPSLANVSWLPSFVFPFAKSLQSSPLLGFEVCVTLIGSWCRLWFSSPSCRSPTSSAVDALLCDASPRLMARLVAADIDTDTYAWPLMMSAFAQVLSPEDWLTAWDHMLSQPPSFLLCFTAAFSLCLQPTIAVAETSAQIRILYGQESFLPVRTVLRRAYDVQRNMRLDDDLLQRLDRVAVFPKGGLPVFDAISDVGSSQQSVEFGLEELDSLMDEVAIETARGELLCREQRCFDNIRTMRKRHLQGLDQYRDGARDVAGSRSALLWQHGS